MLLLLLLIAAVGSANGQQIVGVGKHTVNPDRTVKLAEKWNIATEKGSQPKGYEEYHCPIEINKENGDITVTYTKDGGGKTGCGLDLVAKKPVDDTIRFTIEIATSDPNTCVSKESAQQFEHTPLLSPGYNMLPFIHSVDNQEFQRMSKGGGWFGPDKGNCLDAEQCKNMEDKYQCRKYTTYELGWSILLYKDTEKPVALVKPVAELNRGTRTKPRNYLYIFAPFQSHTLIVTSEKFEVEGSNENDEGIKPNFQCTPQPAELYPVISWTIDNREGTPLNGRQLLFFGLLAQDMKRDWLWFWDTGEALPRCDFSLTFKGGDYELLHQEFVPTTTIPTTTVDIFAPENKPIAWSVLVFIAVVLLAWVGVLIYCMCRNGEEDEEGEEKSEEEEGDQTDAEKGTATKTGAATALRPTAITAVPPTKGDGTTIVDKKTKATTKVTKTVAPNKADQKTKATMAPTKADQKTKVTTKATMAPTKADQKTKVTTKATMAPTKADQKTKAPTKKTKADKTYQEIK